jgi:hypothetical protein
VMVSCNGTDLWRSFEFGCNARTMALTRNVSHSVFSEKWGSQPEMAVTVAF